jgi:hypothetical protein
MSTANSPLFTKKAQEVLIFGTGFIAWIYFMINVLSAHF